MLDCSVANKELEVFLLYTKEHPAMIKGISFPSNGSTEDVISPISGLISPVALDYDAKEEYIYFVDGATERK